MKVENVPVDALIPYARNARTHSDEQVAQVAASIREFGFTNPVLIGKENDIIAGHGRVLAARKLGLKTVPCIRLLDLTENQKRAYIIADNKLALNSGWDEELLAVELSELREIDFNLCLTGFDSEAIEKFLIGEEENENEQNQSETNFASQYAITVICKNEMHQKEIFDQLTKKGLECKVVCV